MKIDDSGDGDVERSVGAEVFRINIVRGEIEADAEVGSSDVEVDE